MSSIAVWSDFTADLVDRTRKVWTAYGNAAITTGALQLDGVGDYIDTPYSADTHFTDREDVTIRFNATVASFGSDMRALLTTGQSTGTANNWSLYATPSGIQFYVYDATTGSAIVDKLWSSVYTAGTSFELSLERKDMIWRLYISGVQSGTSITQIVDYVANTSGKLTVGSEINASGGTSRDLSASIWNLQIIKGYAAGVGGGFTTSTTSMDVDVSSVAACLPLNGVSGSTSFPDARGLVWTPFGAAQISTAKSRFGGSSLALNGTNAYLLTGSRTIFDLWSMDFTVECWFYLTSMAGGPYLFHFTRSPSIRWAVQVDGSTGYVNLYTSTGTGEQYNLGSTVFPLNQWVHLAVSKSGSTTRVFINGVSTYSSTSVTYPTGDMAVTIGSAQPWFNAAYVSGYCGGFRIVNSRAKYTANFNPPIGLDVQRFISSRSLVILGGRTDPPASPPTQISFNETRIRSNASISAYRYLTKYSTDLSASPFTGSGVISGVIDIEGTGASRKVRLYNKSTGLLVSQVMSGADGAYTFINLDPSFEYFVVAHDYNRLYNAVIQDFIQP